MVIKLKRSNKRGSVFTLLFRNYILFTMVLVLLLTAMFIFLLRSILGIASSIDPAQITDYEQILVDQQYAEFPINRLLGSEGGILVLNANCQTVYQNGEPIQLPNLDTGDLACIPKYGTSPEIVKHEFTTAGGQSQVSISIEETLEGLEHFRTYILDENNHILYQPGDLPMDVLTKRQALLLSDSYSTTYSIQKHPFQTADGDPYTLLLIGDQDHPDAADAIVHSFWFLTILLLLTYCAMVLLFILFLNRKIKRPLYLLNLELNNFKSGEKRQGFYRGPKEFVEIFDSFDAMSQRLRHSEEERKKLEDGRQKMLADISHDLKTPITVIHGYAKALQDGLVPPEQQVQYLETMERKTSELNELINTFYEYNKMEHPNYMLNLIPGDICNVLRNYIADRYAELELAGIIVDADIPESHILCAMDTIALRRAFDNIVNNCVKHNPTGATLSVLLTLDGNQVRIVMADNGVGIPSEIRSTIFTPFVVGEVSRSNHGSGLGLSITKKIIEAHHGSITLLEPEAAFGTAYEILLPTI